MNRQIEWSKRTAKVEHDRAGEKVRALRTASMAEVPAAQLAHSDGWHLFQQTMQSKLEESETELRGIERSMLSPGIVGHDELLAIKIRGIIMQERIDVLKAVIDLPKDIQENARAAKQWLERSEWRKQEA